MNTKSSHLLSMVLAICVTGCAILQRESPEKKARELMMAFQENLSNADDEVLKFFETDQSTESLLAAVNLLQNEDNELVKCEADFNNMQLEVEGSDESIKNILKISDRVVKVTVPVTMRANEGDASRQVDLVFWLKEKNNQFIIFLLDGDNFYNAFTTMKHDIQYAQHQHDEIKSRETIYAMADSLRQMFDHVAWYAQYHGEVYFYVVSGDWSEEALYSNDKPRPNFKMGLVNSQGKEIIPVAFDMIGTIGVEVENAVEVNGPEGYGYFSLEGDTLVPPYYTQIIPHTSSDVWMVQSEGRFGWIGKDRNFNEGFPNDQIKESMRKFSYLPSGITIVEGQYALCESPQQEGAGSGVFISPSYWVESGLIERFSSGITTTVTDVPIGGWTEYIEIGETFFQSITEKVGVVITSFKVRYLEGRSEFYEHKKLLFKDSLQHTVLAQDYSRAELEIKKISEDIVEISAAEGRSDDYFEGMPMPGDLEGGNVYRYYRLEENYISELTSNRSHPETEFAKLDNSYINGVFRVYSDSLGLWDNLDTYPVSLLIFMRNEILADYGVAFEDPDVQDRFNNFTWYKKRFNSEAEIQESLTEVDRHNLKFLANAIQEQPASI